MTPRVMQTPYVDSLQQTFVTQTCATKKKKKRRRRRKNRNIYTQSLL